MKILAIILSVLLDVIPMGDAFLRPVRENSDSVVVGDRLRYGFRLDGVKEGTGLLLPELKSFESDTLAIFGDWKIDTLTAAKGRKKKLSYPISIEGSVEIALFEEGEFGFSELPVGRVEKDKIDTLVFGPVSVDVKHIQIDTTTFVPADLKGQMTYPVTFAEVLPWLGGGILLAALVALVFYLVRRKKLLSGISVHNDPPYIVALRKLDKYRSNKYWAPDKQKAYYSGITDALKEYIDGRFGIDAPEMTTEDLFAVLKPMPELTPEMYDSLKEMFETADFVKFAKFSATEEQASAALPLAVRFVTSTYQTEEEAVGN